MMRFFSILLAVLTAFSGLNTVAQEAPSWAATPALWKVSDADTEVFMLGTFHILPGSIDWRSKDVAAAIDRAEQFWFEIESDTPEFAATAQRVAKEHGSNPEGVTLSGLLEDDGATQLGSILTELSFPPNSLEAMKPWQAFLALESLVAVAEGLEPGTGVDVTILQEARARGRTVSFFETTEEQLAQFTDLPPETALALLKSTINAWSEQRRVLPALIKAWGDGDINQVDQYMNDRLRTVSPETYKKLVTDRNKRWSAKIATMLEQPGVIMIAVGATHFAGDHSIPALLEGAGLTVERVINEDVAIAAPAPEEGIVMPADALSKLFPNQPAASEEIAVESEQTEPDPTDPVDPVAEEITDPDTDTLPEAIDSALGENTEIEAPLPQIDPVDPTVSVDPSAPADLTDPVDLTDAIDPASDVDPIKNLLESAEESE